MGVRGPNSVRPVVYAALRKHEGEPMTLDQLAPLLPNLKRNQISDAINGMIKVGGLGIERAGWGAYRYSRKAVTRHTAPEPPKPSSPELLELVGSTNDGASLYRGEDGTYWKAVRA